MKSIKKPSLNEKERVYKLKSAIIHGYEYTKTYYKMENGIPVKCENGDDSCLTMINIRKCGDKTEKKRAFIFSEGYVGLEKSYNKDGKKIKSVSKKDGFGVSYLIKYIENNSSNLVDDFHVIFISDKETSEKQAELYAQAIKGITTDSIEKTYMWSHSKAGLFTLRAFEKMKDSGDKKSEKVLKKVKAVITSMPKNGSGIVNREKVINLLNRNKFMNLMPFSGFIKNGVLAIYDIMLSNIAPAQLDLKKPYTKLNLKPIEDKGKIAKIFNTIWGNRSFQNRVYNPPKLEYDEGYLNRTTSGVNLKKIEDVDYKILPVNIELKDAINALVKHGQIMPSILLLKKVLSGEKGDGLATYSEQGIRDKEIPKMRARYRGDLKFGDTVVHGVHDMGASSGDDELSKLGAQETVGKVLLEDEENEK